MLVADKFAWVPHVKLPVKYLWYSGKFTCARRQCACVLREVLAASKQVNLPVITGKLNVTQVNCARDLFTCELHVKLPAFAGNFARASFTVYDHIAQYSYYYSFLTEKFLVNKYGTFPKLSEQIIFGYHWLAMHKLGMYSNGIWAKPFFLAASLFQRRAVKKSQRSAFLTRSKPARVWMLW